MFCISFVERQMIRVYVRILSLLLLFQGRTHLETTIIERTIDKVNDVLPVTNLQ